MTRTRSNPKSRIFAISKGHPKDDAEKSLTFKTKINMKAYIFLGNEKQKERVLQVLTSIQAFGFRNIPRIDPQTWIWLMYEDWDWLAVMQWLQDNGLLKNNPKRPPLKAFEQWLCENNVPQLHTHYSAYKMSLAHRCIEGARYPWKNVTKHDTGLVWRWRYLYDEMTQLMSE